ncbi:hypothetical protein C6P42_002241 [Pichia californica]|nr:hypothetical protein C6P42_002241 [[Candida] californica]
MVIPQASLIRSIEVELVSDSNITPTADSYTVYIADDSNNLSGLENYNAQSDGITWNGEIKGKYLEIIFTPKYDHSASLLSADFIVTLNIDLTGALAKRDMFTYEIHLSAVNSAAISSTSLSSEITTSSSFASSFLSSSSSSLSPSSSLLSSSASFSSSSTFVFSISSSSSASSSSSSSASSSLPTTLTTVTSTSSLPIIQTLSTFGTITVGQTITEVITSCFNNACFEHTISAVASVAVTTVGTTDITYCPLADSTSTSTSVVATETIISCSDGKCTKLTKQNILNPTANSDVNPNNSDITPSTDDTYESTLAQTYVSIEQLTTSSISSVKTSSVNPNVATYQGKGSQLKPSFVTTLMLIFAMFF